MELQCPVCATPIEVKKESYVVCVYCGMLLKNNKSELEEVMPDE